jgi:hypothetical protein
MFVRKMMLIVAAIAGVALVPNAASARGWRGGGRGRGFGWGAPAIGLGIGLGLGAGYYGAYGGGYYGGGYRGCWRRTVVATPYGPRSRRVWVCG